MEKIKKILVIGANGKVGRIITEKLKDSADFTPTALFRTEGQKEFFEKKNIDYKVASLEGNLEQLKDTMKGMDAVVFSAGSGGKTGDDKTLLVDLDGAVKSMEAALEAEVKRFVMVSALKTDDRSYWEPSGIQPYYVAKYYADRILKDIGLEYTIIRPGLLLDTKGTGKITINDPTSKEGVSREDVAEVVVEVLRQQNSIGKIIEFNGGESEIKEVVRNM